MKTIREIHEGYSKKRFSPLDITQEYLGAIEASRHNAYLTVLKDRALEQAKRAEATLQKEGKVPANQPLFGIPLGIKDVLTMDGVRTTCGSKMLDNYISPYTATSVTRLEHAGAISLGKLNMDEFAMGGSNENSAYGAVLHPTHLDHVPGGSSGGSATATRARLCTASLGTDTGGSIRLPASYCGIVGLKPSYGRISRYGLIAFASSLDQIGPMTATVEDSARLLDVMSGQDPLDASSAPLAPTQTLQALQRTVDWKQLRIGVPREYFVDGVAPAVQKSVQAGLDWFKKQGAQLVDISLPHTQYSVAVYYIVAVSEASSNLARFDGVRFGMRPPEATDAKGLVEFYENVRSQFGAEVKRRIILGTFALSAGYSDAYYLKACQVRRLIQRDFQEAFKKVDLIVGPVSPSTAFKLGEKSKDPLKMYLNDIFTIPANLAGLPGISVPCGEDENRLPIGLHLMSPAFTEDRLLSVAHAYEIGRLA